MPTPAAQLVQLGKLGEALAELQAEIRGKPADAKLRVFLFQLLAINGDWDRALTQLNVAAEMDASVLLMAQACRPALQCEALRAEVFEGKRLPMVLGQPDEWVGRMIQAAQLTAKGGEGNHAGAADLRAQALETAPAISGTADGQPFEWFADADSRLGPMLEAVIDGRYYWIPMSNLAQIEFDKPADLRDLVWTPSKLILANGGEKVALVPTRYPGSESDADPTIRLARRTDWTEIAESVFTGRGQRLFATDIGDFPILELRRVTFGAGSAGSAAIAETGSSETREG